MEKQSKVDTEALVKYQVKCIEFESLLEEREAMKEELREAQKKFSETIAQTEATNSKLIQREAELLRRVRCGFCSFPFFCI
jgi:DNA-binding NarL/FixJ family response regulator